MINYRNGILLSFVLTSLTPMAQVRYQHDRVYTANQISNTVSVVDPSNNTFLGEIVLGRPYPNVLSPLYRGQALVHGLRYCAARKMLAVISIGSNSLTLISTETNKVLKTIYLGRSPHEPTFSPDNKQIWISVRGEAYVSVVDVDRMEEVKRIPVADGPGMVAFTRDGQLAYVCSSFTSEVDVVNTGTYKVIKQIPVVSPFSPNIFTSPDGEWIAMTHKDVGKVTILNTSAMAVSKIISTGAITNHVTFASVYNRSLMMVTVGGENKVRFFDVDQDFRQIDSVKVGALPHGIWVSGDGKLLYVGLEYADMVEGIDLQTMKIRPPIKIGQSPQALVYADNAVSDVNNKMNLNPLNDEKSTQVIDMFDIRDGNAVRGRLAIRNIGLADLVEQIFTGLDPLSDYTLALSRAKNAPFTSEYEMNSFTTDSFGKYSGQSTGLIKTIDGNGEMEPFFHVILIKKINHETVLIDRKINLPG